MLVETIFDGGSEFCNVALCPSPLPKRFGCMENGSRYSKPQNNLTPETLAKGCAMSEAFPSMKQ